jgi:hypothetical protein
VNQLEIGYSNSDQKNRFQRLEKGNQPDQPWSEDFMRGIL